MTSKVEKIVRDGKILVDDSGHKLGVELKYARTLLYINGMLTSSEDAKVHARIVKFRKRYPEAF